jgi:hypothetical protein
MHQEIQQHIEEALSEIRKLFVEAATQIENLKVGEKIPATLLAADLAKVRGQTGPQLYPTLKVLFKGYPYVEVARGAHGGIKRLAVVGSGVAKQPADGDDGVQR